MKQFELFLALEEETCQDLLTTIRPEEETKKVQGNAFLLLLLLTNVEIVEAHAIILTFLPVNSK